MKNNQAIALSSLITALLVLGFASQAYANQLDALLLPDKDESSVDFIGVRFIELKYPQGSLLSNLLNGKNERIEFRVNETSNGTQGNGMDKLIQTINNAILTDSKSPAAIENASLRYFATVKGYPDNAQLAYTVDIKSNITKYLLQKLSGNNQSAIMDLDWRNVVIKEPLLVTTKQYGTINVNYPIGLVQLLYPELAQKLLGSEASGIMQDPIMNFHRFNLPMKSWHFLFDVTGRQLEGYGIFRQGEGKTVSIHSIGESSFREGTYLPEEKDARANIGGIQVQIHASTPPPSGQITIVGYSDVQEKDGTEFAIVSNSPRNIQFGFQFQVLMVLGGMMGAIAVFVLYKSKK